MLEKIGLPAKPSLRGNNWVVDATHCQGCSSQFTFINRKHHCRRCGGIFCNSCTQQRMVLRGQGDSPVRICEPCKKLEEAARFELRYGHKNRAAKGSSKLTLKHEDEVLNQILGSDERESSSSGQASKNHSSDDMQNEMTSASPEELRQRALDEKKKYKILKGEGKPEEALRAFKRGKELERQANALEISMRKNRKKVLQSGSIGDILGEDAPSGSGRKNNLPRQVGKDKDDLAAQLRELGWSDMDFRDDDKKAAGMSLEGELSSLLGEIPRKTDTHGTDKTEVVALKKKALMLKREGKLAEAKEELKRAKVLEKQLEEQELLAGAEDSDDELSAIIRSMDNDKQDEMLIQLDHSEKFDFNHLAGTTDDIVIDGNFEVTEEDMEDPELATALKSLGWTEDSSHAEIIVPQSALVDREALSSEILSLKREALNQKRAGNVSEAMAQLKKAKLLERDLENFDSQLDGTTSQTADRPLGSVKAGEENVSSMRDMDLEPAPKSRLMIQKELLGLKKKALALRREGRVDEAEEELKKGMFLEHQLEEMDNGLNRKTKQATGGSKDMDLAHDQLNISGNLSEREEKDVTDQDMQDPTYLSILRNLGWNEEDNGLSDSSVKQSKQIDSVQISEPSITQAIPKIQAKASRRTKAEIQRELLGLKRKALAVRRQGNTDEAEELLEKAKALEAEMEDIEAPKKVVESNCPKEKISEPTLTDAVDGGSAGDVTENDMNDPMLLSVLKNLGWKDEEPLIMHERPSEVAVGSQSSPGISAAAPRKKGEIQRELLSLKRKAFALRRNGQSEEAEEVLKMAKVLETQMVESENPTPAEDLRSEDIVTTGESEVVNSVQKSQNLEGNFRQFASLNKQDSLRQDILLHKRRAVTLKREGKLSEAREELWQAKLLEKSLAEDEVLPRTGTNDISTVRPDGEEHSASNLGPKKLSGRDRFKLQQESLSHKRQALKLRREGRIQEAEAEFELAKALEGQLEELTAADSTKSSDSADDVVVDDLLDPQLLSALKAIGLDAGSVVSQVPERPVPVKDSAVQSENISQERMQLEERIKAEKIKAVNLKRSGKQAEALDALRRAKLFEKKLNSLT
ncbi:hypothetical protein SLE2022_014470 [Rubroshorea leprosula]